MTNEKQISEKVMKAWIVTDEYDEYMTVIFAESRNHAKIIAMNTDCCEDMDYISIKPRRFKEADKMYRGSAEMEWDDSADRRFLCEHGWSCVELDFSECKLCPCTDVCDKYQDLKEDNEEE